MPFTKPLPLNLTTLGTFRAYYLAVIVFFCAYLEAYDGSIAGAILLYKPFRQDFGYSKADEATVKALTVSLNQAGAFVSCFLVFPAANKWGRKPLILVSAAVFLVGTTVQVINTGSLPVWYVARVVAGFGGGGLAVVVPTYCSEMAPKEIRGRLGSFHQWMNVWGVFVAYWVGYGCKRNIAPISRQWQIPIGLQLVAGGVLFFGALTLPESVRYLIIRKKYTEAWKSLAWIRGVPASPDAKSPPQAADVKAEFESIKRGLLDELSQPALTLRETLSSRSHLNALGLGCGLFMFEQATGATALSSFGPEFFTLVTGNDTDQALLINAFFGVIKVVSCTIFIFFLAERIPRPWVLTLGGLAMATTQLTTSMLLKYQPSHAAGDVGPFGTATVAMIYLSIVFYQWSWGPLPWAYVPELFDTRTRALGMAAAASMHFLFSFVFTFSTPYMLDGTGKNAFGTFLMFVAFDIIMAAFAWKFMKETRGRSLEDLHRGGSLVSGAGPAGGRSDSDEETTTEQEEKFGEKVEAGWAPDEKNWEAR